MKRILILGCCGAGKSTLARTLSDTTGIEIIHLDQEYWNPGWVETPKAQWEKKVIELVKGESWIMDGNYLSTLHIRMPRADTVIYLDKNTFTCLYRVCRRIIRYKGKVRPDMIDGCEERFDLDFLHYVAVFNIAYRKKVLHAVKKLTTTQDVYILDKEKSISNFINIVDAKKDI